MNIFCKNVLVIPMYFFLKQVKINRWIKPHLNKDNFIVLVVKCLRDTLPCTYNQLPYGGIHSSFVCTDVGCLSRQKSGQCISI